MILEEIFPILYNTRITTSIKFNNIITKNNNTSEQRIIQNEYPIREYSLFKNILTASDLSSLRVFFQTTVTARLSGFLFQDPLDNKVTAFNTQVYESGYEVGLLYPDPDGSRTTFQVTKRYQVESSLYHQPIYYPVNLKIYQDAVELTSGFTQDKGTITFDTAPTGNTIFAEYDFYYPVRFKNDILEDEIIARNSENAKTFSLQNLELVEIKPNYSIYPPEVFNQLTQPIPIDLRWGQTSIVGYETDIKTAISQRENRVQRKVLPEYFARLKEKRILSPLQSKFLLFLWLCVKGNGRTFDYKEPVSDVVYSSRFDSDTLTLTNQSNNQIYELQPINIKIFKNGQIVDRLRTLVEPDTFIVFLDADSQTNGSVIQNIISGLKTTLTDLIYDGNSLEADKYILDFAVTEDYLGLLDNNVAGTDPEKYIYFYFINESEADPSGYHSVPRNISNEPQPLYNSQFSSFETRYNNDYISFTCIFLVSTLNTTDPAEIAFRSHIIDSVNGLNGYPGLQQFRMSLRDDLDSNDPNYETIVNEIVERKLGITDFVASSNILSYQPELFLCYLIKITTTMGDVYAYTSHDKDLIIDSITFKASGALSPSAYTEKTDLSLDSIKNDLLFVELDENVLFSGVFNDAEIEIAVISWKTLPASLNNTDYGIIDYQKGVAGEITSHGGLYYSIEFLSYAASKLNQTFVRKTQSNCPYEFMDATTCQYPYQEWIGTVNQEIAADWVRVTGSYDQQQMRNGKLTFLSGELKGTTYTVNRIEEGDKVILTKFLLKSPAVGDQVRMVPGCKKTEQSCKDYNNFVNFGGIPAGGGWMPGNYYLINAPRRS